VQAKKNVFANKLVFTDLVHAKASDFSFFLYLFCVL